MQDMQANLEKQVKEKQDISEIRKKEKEEIVSNESLSSINNLNRTGTLNIPANLYPELAKKLKLDSIENILKKREVSKRFEALIELVDKTNDLFCQKFLAFILTLVDNEKQIKALIKKFSGLFNLTFILKLNNVLSRYSSEIPVAENERKEKINLWIYNINPEDTETLKQATTITESHVIPSIQDGAHAAILEQFDLFQKTQVEIKNDDDFYLGMESDSNSQNNKNLKAVFYKGVHNTWNLKLFTCEGEKEYKLVINEKKGKDNDGLKASVVKEILDILNSFFTREAKKIKKLKRILIQEKLFGKVIWKLNMEYYAHCTRHYIHATSTELHPSTKLMFLGILKKITEEVFKNSLQEHQNHPDERLVIIHYPDPQSPSGENTFYVPLQALREQVLLLTNPFHAGVVKEKVAEVAKNVDLAGKLLFDPRNCSLGLIQLWNDFDFIVSMLKSNLTPEQQSILKQPISEVQSEISQIEPLNSYNALSQKLAGIQSEKENQIWQDFKSYIKSKELSDLVMLIPKLITYQKPNEEELNELLEILNKPNGSWDTMIHSDHSYLAAIAMLLKECHEEIWQLEEKERNQLISELLIVIKKGSISGKMLEKFESISLITKLKEMFEYLMHGKDLARVLTAMMTGKSSSIHKISNEKLKNTVLSAFDWINLREYFKLNRLQSALISTIPIFTTILPEQFISKKIAQIIPFDKHDIVNFYKGLSTQKPKVLRDTLMGFLVKFNSPFLANINKEIVTKLNPENSASKTKEMELRLPNKILTVISSIIKKLSLHKRNNEYNELISHFKKLESEWAKIKLAIEKSDINLPIFQLYPNFPNEIKKTIEATACTYIPVEPDFKMKIFSFKAYCQFFSSEFGKKMLLESGAIEEMEGELFQEQTLKGIKYALDYIPPGVYTVDQLLAKSEKLVAEYRKKLKSESSKMEENQLEALDFVPFHHLKAQSESLGVVHPVIIFKSEPLKVTSEQQDLNDTVEKVKEVSVGHLTYLLWMALQTLGLLGCKANPSRNQLDHEMLTTLKSYCISRTPNSTLVQSHEEVKQAYEQNKKASFLKKNQQFQANIFYRDCMAHLLLLAKQNDQPLENELEFKSTELLYVAFSLASNVRDRTMYNYIFMLLYARLNKETIYAKEIYDLILSSNYKNLIPSVEEFHAILKLILEDNTSLLKVELKNNKDNFFIFINNFYGCNLLWITFKLEAGLSFYNEYKILYPECTIEQYKAKFPKNVAEPNSDNENVIMTIANEFNQGARKPDKFIVVLKSVSESDQLFLVYEEPLLGMFIQLIPSLEKLITDFRKDWSSRVKNILHLVHDKEPTNIPKNSSSSDKDKSQERNSIDNTRNEPDRKNTLFTQEVDLIMFINKYLRSTDLNDTEINVNIFYNKQADFVSIRKKLDSEFKAIIKHGANSEERYRFLSLIKKMIDYEKQNEIRDKQSIIANLKNNILKLGNKEDFFSDHERSIYTYIKNYFNESNNTVDEPAQLPLKKV